MEYIPTAQKSRVIKKALSKEFGHKNVRVVKGRGTASHWVEAEIRIPRPIHICYCGDEVFGTCGYCKLAKGEANKKADQIAIRELKKIGARFATYYSDDGIGTERSCFLLTVKFQDV